MNDISGALLLTADARIEVISLPASNSLPTMRTALGCDMVDVLRLSDHLDMWFDDEYLYNHAGQPNTLATEIARRFQPGASTILGPVLLTGIDQSTGETLPLTVDRLRMLLSAVLGSVS